MRLSINLRSDLAKLSDTELNQRLEQAWEDYESAKNRLSDWSRLIFSFRGPFRHPRAYRFLAVLSGASYYLPIDLLLATVLSDKQYEKPLAKVNVVAGVYLSHCEIKDIVDEIERRLAIRKAAARL